MASRTTNSSLLFWWLILLVSVTLTLPGCRGCSEDPGDENLTPEALEKRELKKKEKPKPDFESVKLSIVPQKTGENETKIKLVKPGHWTAAVEETKANNFDFVGQIFSEVREDGLGKPVDLERTPHRLAFIRPAPLAKGVAKYFELLFFVPRDRIKAWFASELRSRGGSIAATPGPEPLQLMKAYQYNLVVLGAEADRYRPLEKFDAIKAPHSASLSFNAPPDLENALNYYQVIAPPLVKPLPIPSNAMAWTSIAYVIWDDVDPALLSPEQQQAMVDWLHWGGQLIISGPKSLDQLRGTSFLGPYLPALPGEPLKITAEMLKPLSKYWTVPDAGRQLAPINPWSGITLKPEPGSKPLDETAGLVIERQVGRGRIVVTAFRLCERQLLNWPSFDGFLNACLLRRPPRAFSESPEPPGYSVNWKSAASRARDPALVTRVRYFSRDWSDADGFTPPLPHREQDTTSQQQAYNRRGNLFGTPPPSDDLPLELDATSSIGPGVAAWNDFSEISNAARVSLQDAAGIVIPNAEFVVWVLILYLVVLVPLNWLLFWGLGRVEWAWIAAPIIAIGGMAAVVKLAQLDIGFARSQTELAVLETHNGYPRGHLTRYTALYTSLSTTYDVNSEEQSTVVLPFSADPNFTPIPGQAYDTVTYHSDPAVQLSDFAVSSNSTAMLHSEQMIDLGGAIDYIAKPGGGEITNHTRHTLTRAAVIRRTDDGDYQLGWIGELPAGRGAKISFLRPQTFSEVVPKWSFEINTTSDEHGPKLNLDHMVDLVRGEKKLENGETRLIAMIEGPLPGLAVDPAASQTGRGATLVVGTLQPPPLDAATPDINNRRQVAPDRGERDVTEPDPVDAVTAPES